MNLDVMRHTLHQSEAGQLTFPMVIDALSAVGVESYFADLTRRTDTFYMPNGETHVEAMNHPPTKIAEDFSKLEIVAAIRAAQADQIRYPEFIKTGNGSRHHGLLGLPHRQESYLLWPQGRFSH